MSYERKIHEANKLLAKGYTIEAANMYVSLSQEVIESGNPDRALEIILNAVNLFKKESEFYKAGMALNKAGEIYKSRADFLEAGRQFSRSGNLFTDVKAYDEAAKSFNSAGDMFLTLKKEFFIEAGKHYKMAALSLIYHPQHQAAEYLDSIRKAEQGFRLGYEDKQTSRWNYYLYLENLYSDIHDALDRNGLYRDSGAMYLKRMGAVTKRATLNRRDWIRCSALTVWNWTSGYGERPLRWVGWIMLLLLAFSGVYYTLDIVRDAVGAKLSYFECLYFSFNIFATLGFGTYQLMSNLAYFVITVNVFLGYLMMAVLITIIARKLTK